LNEIKKYIKKLEELISNKFNSDHFLEVIITIYLKIKEPIIAFELSKKIWNIDDRYIYIRSVLSKLGKQRNIEHAIEFAQGITDFSNKSRALASISTELVQKGKVEEGASMIKEAHSIAWGICDESEKSSALKYISTELVQQGKVEEALACARGISVEWRKSSALKYISGELAKQEKIEEALECARGISDDYNKSVALKSISCEFIKKNHLVESALALQEAHAFARGICDESKKSSVLHDISTELVQQGKVEEALTCARGISIEWRKSRVLRDISTELFQQGKVEEAFECARGISDESSRSIALQFIYGELYKQGNWSLADTIIENWELAKRQEIWKNHAINIYMESGWQKSLQQVIQLQSEEACLHYINGWAEKLDVRDCSHEILLLTRKYFLDNLESLELVLQKLALHQLFIEEIDPTQIQRFNRTLNIQWAIDIKNQLPN
jgi:hypothetical protein